MQRWLRKCSESSSHSLCSSEPLPLPRRLLRLEFGGAYKSVRLVECLEGQKGIYVAFSHCWGEPGAVPKTTRDNYGSHLAGIPFESLPLSYQDVADVCWGLGVHYLWIDSLCIIQGDERDWQHQSTKMTDIYQRAFLTVAATASSSCLDGLHLSRQPAHHIDIVNSDGSEEVFAIRPRADASALRQLPLFRRGWTLQETVNSRRVVHFARDQLYWGCRSKSQSEDGMGEVDVDPLPTCAPGTPIPIAAWDTWWLWIEDYSRRQLSVASDKLPAIAGLTRKFQDMVHACPALGLWMEDIHFGLLWWPTISAARTISDIPSWSWASVDGPVRAPYGRWKRKELRAKATIPEDHLTVTWTGEELTSAMSTASLRARGRLRTAAYIPGYSIVFNIIAGHTREGEPGYQPHAQLLDGSYRCPSCLIFDNGLQVSAADPHHPNPNSIWCFEILEEPGVSQSFLILELVDPKQKRYRRIGVGYVSSSSSRLGDNDFFKAAATEEIMLV